MSAAAAGIQDPTPGQAGGVRRLISKYANWTVWLGVTLLGRLLLDDTANWGLALRTRYCPQLGGAAVEELISVVDGAEGRTRLVHLVTLRKRKGAAQAGREVLDAVFAEGAA